MQEHRRKCHTCNDAPDNHRHEVLSLAKKLDRHAVGLLGNDVLSDNQQEIEQEDGVDSLEEKLKAQHLQRYHEQRQVDDDVGVLYMEARGIVDNGRETGYTTRHNLIGHEEHRERNGIKHDAERDEEIVLHLIPILDILHHLLNDNINDFLWNDDHFHNLFALHVLQAALIGFHFTLYSGVVGVGCKRLLIAGFTVEADCELHFALHKILFIVAWPCCIAHGSLVAKHMPQFFGHVGSKR